MAGGFDVKAQRVHPIGGEVEFGLALFGDGDVEDRRIVFAGADAQRPIFPGGGHQIQRQPEAVGHQAGDVRIAADQRFIVIGEQRQRWGVLERHRHRQLAGHRKVKVRRNQCDSGRVRLCAYRLSVSLQIDTARRGRLNGRAQQQRTQRRNPQWHNTLYSLLIMGLLLAAARGK